MARDKAKPSQQGSLDFDIAVSTRLPETQVRKIDEWAERGLRKRSNVLEMLLRRVLSMIEETNSFDRPVDDVVRRLRLDPA